MKRWSIIALIVLLLAGGAGAGWYFWDKNKDNQANTTPNSKQSDPYEGWKSYENNTYGISFRYPADWKIDEVELNSTDSATSQEYAINVKRNQEVKYNNTINIEVLAESLDEAAAWYDNYFTQSSSSKVSKTTNKLKGRQSVQYISTESEAETKLYLFGAGIKTYLFSSINEWFNIQSDAQYWVKFDKVFESLEVT